MVAPATGNGCPVGKFYKVHSDRQTWGDAMEACEQEDAHLAVIDSHTEAVDLIEMIEKAETTKWVHWIGFHDHFREGEYTTVFSEYVTQLSSGSFSPSFLPSPALSERSIKERIDAVSTAHTSHDRPRLTTLEAGS